MQWRVTSMRFHIDINLVLASQEFNQVEVSMFGCPVQSGVSSDEIFGLGKPWVITEHLDQTNEGKKKYRYITNDYHFIF